MPHSQVARWLIFVAAAFALAFANGEHANPVAAWLGPALMLIAVRVGTGWRTAASGYVCYLAAWLFAWHGVLRLGPQQLAPMAVILSVPGYAPFLIHRALAPRLPLVAASLVFAAAMATVEYLVVLSSPFGSWGLIGYSQVEWPAFAQFASLAGTLGIGFLMSWGGATAAELYLRWRERGARTLAAVYLLSFAAVIGWGHARLAGASSVSKVRVAMAIPHIQNNLNYRDALAPQIIKQLLTSTQAAIDKGARLVVWPEDSFFLSAAEESGMLERVQAIADRSGAHIGMAYGLRVKAGDLAYHGRFTLLAPGRKVAWRYDKSFRVPGYEISHMIPGDGRMARTKTPLGELAGAICFDVDQDGMMRQTGAADLFIAPSDDWPAIHTLHARMAVMRAIERGRPLVRPTINGQALMTDDKGRTIVGKSSYRAAGTVLLGDVPPGGDRTFYDRSGPVIGILSLFLLGALGLGAMATRRRTSKTVHDR